MNPPLIYVQLYQSRGKKVTASSPGFRPQNWRWRAVNANNRKKMATSGEAYHNKSECLAAALQLFADATVDPTLLEQANVTGFVQSNVYMQQPGQGEQVMRLHPAVEQ